MNKAASVKAKLMNVAEKERRSYQEVLQAYGLERVIYRLSRSRFADKFTLKGGIFLYALFNGEYSRSTTDIDLLGRQVSREKEALKAIFEEVLSVDLEDGIVFDPLSIQTDDIAQVKAYPGVRITALAYLEKTRIPITIDIGFGDSIVPSPITLPFPAILEDSTITVSAYSIESVVAEKLEAMTSLGFFNSRYKDFYDICMLSRSFAIDGKQLAAAIAETFSKRNTSLQSVASFEESFVSDTVHQRRWRAFISKKAVLSTLTLGDAVNEIKRFILPVLVAHKEGKPFDKVWDHVASMWR